MTKGTVQHSAHLFGYDRTIGTMTGWDLASDGDVLLHDVSLNEFGMSLLPSVKETQTLKFPIAAWYSPTYQEGVGRVMKVIQFEDVSIFDEDKQRSTQVIVNLI